MHVKEKTKFSMCGMYVLPGGAMIVWKCCCSLCKDERYCGILNYDKYREITGDIQGFLGVWLFNGI